MTRKMSNTPQIIIGTNHHNTLGIVKSLGIAGIPVILIVKGGKGFVEKSKYVTECFHIENAEHCLSILDRISYDHTEKLIVISTSDLFTHILDLNYDKLSQKFKIPNCYNKNGEITYFMNKDMQVEIASKIGMNVPYTITYNWESKIPKPEKFPIIIKPLKSIGGGKNICICESQEELEPALSHFDRNYPIQIQKFIKKEYEIVVLGCVVDGKVIVPGFIRKHRDEKGGTTFSTVYNTDKLQGGLIEKVTCFIKEIGYTGMWGVEFIFSNNEFYFIEANLRCDATTYSLTVAGVNLPYIYSMLLEGKEYASCKSIETMNSMVEFGDIFFLLKRKISFKEWRRDLKSCKIKYFYDKNDMRPFYAKFCNFIVYLFIKIFYKVGKNTK